MLGMCWPWLYLCNTGRLCCGRWCPCAGKQLAMHRHFGKRSIVPMLHFERRMFTSTVTFRLWRHVWEAEWMRGALPGTQRLHPLSPLSPVGVCVAVISERRLRSVNWTCF